MYPWFSVSAPGFGIFSMICSQIAPTNPPDSSATQQLQRLLDASRAAIQALQRVRKWDSSSVTGSWQARSSRRSRARDEASAGPASRMIISGVSLIYNPAPIALIVRDLLIPLDFASQLNGSGIGQYFFSNRSFSSSSTSELVVLIFIIPDEVFGESTRPENRSVTRAAFQRVGEELDWVQLLRAGRQTDGKA